MKKQTFSLEGFKKDKDYSFFRDNSRRRVNLARKISKRRKEIGLTQGDLAKKVKTTQSIISEIESGDYNVGFELLSRIFFALSIDSNILAEIFEIPVVVNSFSFEAESSFYEENYSRNDEVEKEESFFNI